jgi:hypothetical protein
VKPARALAKESVLFPAPDGPHSKMPDPLRATQAVCSDTT